jgi:hypothetical protein
MNANEPEETLEGGVVISSAILLCWLVTVLLFEYFYKPARQGRKIAYLTVASFVFLALVLGIVILGKHAADDLTTTQLPSTSVPGKQEAMR